MVERDRIDVFQRLAPDHRAVSCSITARLGLAEVAEILDIPVRTAKSDSRALKPSARPSTPTTWINARKFDA